MIFGSSCGVQNTVVWASPNSTSAEEVLAIRLFFPSAGLKASISASLDAILLRNGSIFSNLNVLGAVMERLNLFRTLFNLSLFRPRVRKKPFWLD
jgi:hypothetical protein